MNNRTNRILQDRDTGNSDTGNELDLGVLAMVDNSTDELSDKTHISNIESDEDICKRYNIVSDKGFNIGSNIESDKESNIESNIETNKESNIESNELQDLSDEIIDEESISDSYISSKDSINNITNVKDICILATFVIFLTMLSLHRYVNL
jgi:hypothetical protein